MTEILVEHSVAFADKQPYVTVKTDAKRHQLSPQEARDLGLTLMQAAATAQVEAFVHTFATELGGNASDAAALLLEFRKHEVLDDTAVVVLIPNDTDTPDTVSLHEAINTGCWFLDVAAMSTVTAMLARYLAQVLQRDAVTVERLVAKFSAAYTEYRHL